MADWDKVDSHERLDELDRYDLLDTPPEEAFDRITRLVCRSFGVKMATVTLIDGHRQWFKSRQGVDAQETDRQPAFCRMPVANDQPLIVPDTHEDPQFRDNAFVTGAPHLRFYAGVPIRSSRGIPIGTLCAMDSSPHAFGPDDLAVLTDLGKLVETELDLRAQAGADSLTGVLSRRALVQEVARALALAQRHRHDLSCVVFGIDQFKRLNEENGHAAGDEVLRRIALASGKQLRKSDIFGRLGGKAFAAALPHTSAADAVKVAEKLRRAIETESTQILNRTLSVTASFGVAWLDQNVADVQTLIERANHAMSLAKSRGRNCTVLWQGTSPEARAPQRRVLKAGQIVFNGGQSVIDCTVRRLSDVGAQIDVSAPEGVPGRFKLAIAADSFSRACSILRREERQIEVAFD